MTARTRFAPAPAPDFRFLNMGFVALTSGSCCVDFDTVAAVTSSASSSSFVAKSTCCSSRFPAQVRAVYLPPLH